LRAALEARDRDAAELRAALRAALAVMPKAITAGAPSGADAQVLAADETAQNGTPAQVPTVPVLAAPEIQDQSGPQVLAANGSDGAAQTGEFRARDGATIKAAGHDQSGPETGGTARESATENGATSTSASTLRRARGFRGWLLQVLAGR
jgi:hypothetical protein